MMFLIDYHNFIILIQNHIFQNLASKLVRYYLNMEHKNIYVKLLDNKMKKCKIKFMI